MKRIQSYFGVFFFSFLQQCIDNDCHHQHNIFIFGLQLNNRDKVNEKVVLTSRNYTDKDNQGNGWYYDMRMLRVLGRIVISYHNTAQYGGSGYWLVLFPAQPTDGDSSCRNPSPKPLPDAVSQT